MFLALANEVCEGYVFTPVCQSFCSWGVGMGGMPAPLHAGIHPPGQVHPLAGTPPQVHPPVGTPTWQVPPWQLHPPHLLCDIC